jgi:hypothetical protein
MPDKLFPDLLIPGWMLSAAELDDLIAKAQEILDETDNPFDKSSVELVKFINDACRLRAVHDGKFSL